MSKTPDRYVSHLLRVWQDNRDQEPTWCASLQVSLNGERQVFASLDHLFAFLRRRVGPICETDGLDKNTEDR